MRGLHTIIVNDSTAKSSGVSCIGSGLLPTGEVRVATYWVEVISCSWLGKCEFSRNALQSILPCILQYLLYHWSAESFTVYISFLNASVGRFSLAGPRRAFASERFQTEEPKPIAWSRKYLVNLLVQYWGQYIAWKPFGGNRLSGPPENIRDGSATSHIAAENLGYQTTSYGWVFFEFAVWVMSPQK